MSDERKGAAEQWRADAEWLRREGAVAREIAGKLRGGLPSWGEEPPAGMREEAVEHEVDAARYERLADLALREARAAGTEPLEHEVCVRSEAYLRTWRFHAPATAELTERPVIVGADTVEAAKAGLAARLRSTARALESGK